MTTPASVLEDENDNKNPVVPTAVWVVDDEKSATATNHNDERIRAALKEEIIDEIRQEMLTTSAHPKSAEVVPKCPPAMAIAPVVLGSLGVIFSALALFTCFVVPVDANVGILYGYNCLRIIPCSACSEEDWFWIFAKIMIGWSIAAGMLVTLGWTVSCCYPTTVPISRRRHWWVTVGISYLSLTLTSLFSLVGQNTTQCSGHGACAMGPGMKLMIAASIMFGGAGFSVLFFLCAKSYIRGTIHSSGGNRGDKRQQCCCWNESLIGNK